MRCFIALELSDEIRSEFSRITGILKGSGAAVKWVGPENIHLTLKFLGDVPKNKINAVTDKLKNITADLSSFSITPGNIGVFPGWNRPRVIWIGVEQGGDAVKALAAQAISIKHRLVTNAKDKNGRIANLIAPQSIHRFKHMFFCQSTHAATS